MSNFNSFTKSKKILKGKTLEELKALIKLNEMRWELGSDIKFIGNDIRPHQVLMIYKAA